ncbi:fructosamine kinase family protein [Xylanimonas protaetiae]|uniref:Aminoglycoside phosphotransferase n=1 Tax=Xylanimonas protaetiae TaxID=2509457 RepID=A0A4P6FA66_9MICO|nr:fructosamine kinase family protein [Xylanimonas protaetiae]QAY71179.1 aminoglycoside phosphotransferase [Xylanimonas protaetiae]
MTDPDAPAAAAAPDLSLLLDRLHAAGLRDVVAVDPAPGGQAATAGLARRSNGGSLFVKTFAEPPSDDAFAAEAEGLAALRDAGAATPEVVVTHPDLLVLTTLAPRPATEAFWERLAHTLAHLHTSTRHARFGWHQDNWLGRRRQVNTWTDDGFEFFAQHRLLRWLDEPKVRAALDAADRAALEHLCERLPELLPERPACLVHGDLWAGNVLATPDGGPALIDPAVSYTWAEIDLAHLWTTAPPPEAHAFFDLYADLTGLDAGWRDRMPIVQLRQHLAVIAQFEPDWGAAETTRTTLAPFRRRR